MTTRYSSASITRPHQEPHRAVGAGAQLCAGRTFSPGEGQRGPDALVFCDGVHYLPRPKSTDGWFVAATKRAKVQKITPHDLRHTCASIALSSGVNVLALSRMLGHQSAKVTLDTYADLFDTDLDAVAEALDLKCAHSVPKARPVTAG